MHDFNIFPLCYIYTLSDDLYYYRELLKTESVQPGITKHYNVFKCTVLLELNIIKSECKKDKRN